MKKSDNLLKCAGFLMLLWFITGFSACGKKDNPTYGEFMVVNASPGFGPVDIYVDNNKITTSALAYPSHTSYATLEAGQHTVKVTAAGNTTSIFEGNLNTLGDINQSMFIYGLPTSLNVFAVADNTFSPSTGKALIRFFHLSPGGQTVDVGKLNGATFTAYTFIRLNGAIKFLFHDWLYKNFPERADKVWHLIENSHDGQVNDTRWGVRMRGEGPIAQLVAQQYRKYGKLYGMNAEEWSLNRSLFKRPGEQGRLF